MLCYFNKVYVVVHQVQFKVHRIKCNLAIMGFAMVTPFDRKERYKRAELY